MVKIEIDGNKLKLSSGQKIRFKLRNPMMYEDVLPKYYSFPFNIDLSNGTNSFMLNYPQIWNNANKISRKIDASIYLFGSNNPKKSVLNFNTVSNETAEINITVEKNVDDIADKKLNELDFGTITLENTVYKYIRLQFYPEILTSGLGTFFSFHYCDTILVISGVTFTVPVNPSNTKVSVMSDLIAQINASDLPINANLIYVSSVPVIELIATIPGTEGAFTLDNLSELARNHNPDIAPLPANFAINSYYFDFPKIDEDTWIDNHVKAVRTSVKNLIDSYNPDTSTVVFPLVENVKFIDDEQYTNLQNGLFTDILYNKESLVFLTPMIPLHIIIKKAFKALGFDVVGSFINDAGIKRIIVYSNVAADFFTRYYGNDGATSTDESTYTNPIFDIDKDINIHASTITVARHCPDMSIKEFITALRTAFNLEYNYNYQNKTVDISIYQSDSNNLIQNAKDFTKQMVNKFQLQNSNANATTIKSFKFETDSSDDKPKQLGILDYQEPLVIDKNAKKEITPKISSICEESVYGFSKLAAVQIPGYYNNQGSISKLKLLQYFHRPSVPDDITIPDFAKIKTDSSYFLMPFALNKDTYPFFTYVSNWSLSWPGEKGLYKKCWEKQTQLLNDGTQVKTAITFSNTDLINIGEHLFHILNGSIAVWKDIDVEVDEENIATAEVIYQLL